MLCYTDIGLGRIMWTECNRILMIIIIIIFTNDIDVFPKPRLTVHRLYGSV